MPKGPGCVFMGRRCWYVCGGGAPPGWYQVLYLEPGPEGLPEGGWSIPIIITVPCIIHWHSSL